MKAYLEAENAWLESVMAPLKELRSTLVAEMKARIIEEDTSVPYRKGGWLYYGRDVAGKDHPLICRNPGIPTRPPTCSRPPRPGRKSSCSISTSAPAGRGLFLRRRRGLARRTALRVEGEPRRHRPLHPADPRPLQWSDPARRDRGNDVRRGAGVGARQPHPLLHPRRRDRPSPGASCAMSSERMRARTRSSSRKRTSASAFPSTGRRAAVFSSSPPRRRTRTRFPPAARRARRASAVFFSPGEEIRTSYADRGDEWFILSNEGAVNGRVFRAPLADPARGNWVEVLPGDEAIAYESVDAFATRVVLGARRGGVPASSSSILTKAPRSGSPPRPKGGGSAEKRPRNTTRRRSASATRRC